MSGEDKGIQKFAFSEARTLIKLYTNLLYQWAAKDDVSTVTPTIREALLSSISRLYEVVEGMPDSDGGKRLH